jgi:hypothetical protein
MDVFDVVEPTISDTGRAAPITRPALRVSSVRAVTRLAPRTDAARELAGTLPRADAGRAALAATGDSLRRR